MPIHFFGDGYWNVIAFLWCIMLLCFYVPIDLHCFYAFEGTVILLFQIGFSKERFSPWNGCKGANQVECSIFGSWKGTVSNLMRFLSWGQTLRVMYQGDFPVELIIPGSQLTNEGKRWVRNTAMVQVLRWNVQQWLGISRQDATVVQPRGRWVTVPTPAPVGMQSQQWKVAGAPYLCHVLEPGLRAVTAQPWQWLVRVVMGEVGFRTLGAWSQHWWIKDKIFIQGQGLWATAVQS